ncbi:DUF551 domain-containing protein [Edwardsiella piscicida]|uniref:DUF551 domain-containing protein n=1 Tax=Edwardsiella piscicida TaxID=1263550 RepID=UPI00247A8C4F|nr:DUF551 domain-containing protein [Edwardsiella piscicida]WGS75576.1 DUF551 domain-containing protein [Edwardsiella piscicida]WGS78965.1 DUF551 domain-containing protein [Edwardsiella piscicida]
MNMREEFEKWFKEKFEVPDFVFSGFDESAGEYSYTDETEELYIKITMMLEAWKDAQPKWIKCSEQMPPVNTWVLVATDTGRCYTAYFNELLNSWDDGSFYSDIKGVVGWCNMTPPFGIQPPNPPEE